MTGRSPSGRALAVPATPAGAVDGPSGFDPSRTDAIIHEMARVIALHGFGTIDGRSRKTPPNDKWTVDEWRARVLDCVPVLVEVRCAVLAQELYAIATEARRAETENTGSVHEGAGRNAALPENKAVDPYALGGGK